MYKSILFSIFTALGSYAQNVEIFAHRGFRGMYPENTITAFTKTLHHTSTIEMDIMLTKDLEVVVTHDAILNKKLYVRSNGSAIKEDEKIKIYELNSTDLKQFNLGTLIHHDFPEQIKIKEHIPLLSDVIDTVTKYAKQNNLSKPKYFIETKIKETTDFSHHPEPKVVVELLVKVLKKHGVSSNDVIIQSFDPRTLSYIEKHYPEYKTCLLDGKKKLLSIYLNELDFKPDYFSPSFDEINETTLKESKMYNIPLIGGNSNSKSKIDQMYKWGITKVISDYPYHLLKD